MSKAKGKALYQALVAVIAVWPLAAAQGATIDLLLDVVYHDPSNDNGGGRWNLYAKASDYGVASLQMGFLGLEPFSGVSNLAPHGYIYGGIKSGLWMSRISQADTTKLTFAQSVSPNIPPDYQVMFYGVGTTSSGTPGHIGPLPASIAPSSFFGVPWATFAPAPGWETSVCMASGAFSNGGAPHFSPVSALHRAGVFTALPDPAAEGSLRYLGKIESATVTTLTRDNLGLGAGAITSHGDFNSDGLVNAADYTVWRNIDGTAETYARWKNGYGERPLSEHSHATAVPEPAMLAGCLCVIGAGAVARCCGRRM